MSSPSDLNLPTDRVHRLHNVTCGYCGNPFNDALPQTLEHVIGRRFVPKGTLQAVFNLHLNACHPCNNVKSDLEDDISVISMHANALGQYPTEDAVLRQEVERKSGSAFSRRTGKPVAQGEPPLVIKAQMLGADFTVTMHAPPQADDERLFTLARFHFQGFFYLLTYKEAEKRGSLFPGDFFTLISVRKGDWGNPLLRWFERETSGWLPRLQLITANGYFKMLIRRKDEQSAAWAWVVEWNNNYRLAGFAGAEDDLREVFARVPNDEAKRGRLADGSVLGVRVETPLSVEEDALFSDSPTDQPTVASHLI
jgi:hypothetical protein